MSPSLVHFLVGVVACAFVSVMALPSRWSIGWRAALGMTAGCITYLAGLSGL
jgi:hypothetical protein